MEGCGLAAQPEREKKCGGLRLGSAAGMRKNGGECGLCEIGSGLCVGMMVEW